MLNTYVSSSISRIGWLDLVYFSEAAWGWSFLRFWLRWRKILINKNIIRCDGWSYPVVVKTWMQRASFDDVGCLWEKCSPLFFRRGFFLAFGIDTWWEFRQCHSDDLREVYSTAIWNHRKLPHMEYPESWECSSLGWFRLSNLPHIQSLFHRPTNKYAGSHESLQNAGKLCKEHKLYC